MLFRQGFLLCVLLLGFQQLSGQLIDSALQAELTANDSINNTIRFRYGFDVRIIKPKLMRTRGKKIINGYKKYYLYVVSTDEVYIGGVPLISRQSKIYLVIWSDSKRIRRRYIPDTINSRAGLLKGMLNAQTDSLISYYQRQAQKNLKLADSLEKSLDQDEPLEYLTTNISARDKARREAYNNRYFYTLYTKFKKTKGKKGRVKRFMFKPLFSAPTLKYSLYNAPGLLPKVVKLDHPKPKEKKEPKQKVKKVKKKKLSIPNLFKKNPKPPKEKNAKPKKEKISKKKKHSEEPSSQPTETQP